MNPSSSKQYLFCRIDADFLSASCGQILNPDGPLPLEEHARHSVLGEDMVVRASVLYAGIMVSSGMTTRASRCVSEGGKVEEAHGMVAGERVRRRREAAL